MTLLRGTHRFTRPMGTMLMALFIGGGMASNAMADTLVKFKGGIGVNPVSAITGFPTDAATDQANRNDVRGVRPGGQPWVIDELKASVKDDGRIKVKGKGLLFAGGNVIGSTGPVEMVAATLFCGPADTASAHNSGAVPLDPNGDFRIDAVLDTAPPSPCDTPVLLVGAPNEDGGVARWFAAGIPTRESDDGDKDDDDNNGMGETTTTDEVTGAELRLRCEVRPDDRSKISVDVKNVDAADGPFKAIVISGMDMSMAEPQGAVDNEVEFDFDSNVDDVAEGATAIDADFIKDKMVKAMVLAEDGMTIAEGTVECAMED